MIRRLAPPLIVLLLLGGFVYWSSRTPVAEPDANVRLPVALLAVASTTLSVEVARSDVEREKGLSGRAGLAPGKGMLFVFPVAEPYGFWMPNMNFAIDIIWIDADKKIVYIVPNATPESYPHVFAPPARALYVLEVPTGDAARYGWKAGDSVGIPTNF